MIVVVDYGMGNTRSVSKALQHLGQTVLLTSDPADIRRAERVVVPGQGALGDGMRQLERSGALEAVRYAAENKPFLGICVGMQILFDRGEEGDALGLGVLHGTVPRLRPAPGIWVPHVGWGSVEHARKHELWHGIRSGERFYFAHSYYPVPDSPKIVAGLCEYGSHFVCAVAKDNIFGVQFHPEKSQPAGLQLLANFIAWCP